MSLGRHNTCFGLVGSAERTADCSSGNGYSIKRLQRMYQLNVYVLDVQFCPHCFFPYSFILNQLEKYDFFSRERKSGFLFICAHSFVIELAELTIKTNGFSFEDRIFDEFDFPKLDYFVSFPPKVIKMKCMQ